MGGLITVYDPQGNRGQIPEDQLQAAVKAGGMPAVKMRDPQGNEDYVPANRTHDAIAAGGKLVPLEDQDVQHPGLWKTLSDAGSAMWQHVKEIPSAIGGPDPLADPRVSDEEKNKIVAQQEAAAAATNEARRQAHGEGYSLAATAGEMAGVPVASAEKHAEEGNVGGVIGDVAFMPATVAVTHGITKAAPKVYDFGANLAENLKETTPKQAAQAAGGVAGTVSGHGTLSAPGAFYGAKTGGKLAEFVLGKERANQPIFKSSNPLDATGENQPFAGETEPPPTKVGKPAQLPEAFQGPGRSYQAPVGTADRPFKLSEAPTQAVMTAVDELGPKATTEQIAARTQEVMARPATPKSLQAPATPTSQFSSFIVKQAKNELGAEATPAQINQRAAEITNQNAGVQQPSPVKEAPFTEEKGGTLFHGTGAPEQFSLGDKPLYTAINSTETHPFAKGEVEGVGGGSEPSVIKLNAKPGKVVNIDDQLVEAIQEGKAGNEEAIQGLLRQAKAQGARYASFTHPALQEQDFQSIASLYPKEDLEVQGHEPLSAEQHEYPPPAPETPIQPSKLTPADVAETADIRERARQTFEREQRTAQRIAQGEYKERNDVSVPKGTLNQSLDTTQSDVSLADRSATKQPTAKQLPEIADPQQAMRQLENLQKAGASPKAIQEFEGRAATRFGDNWKHIAGQADDLLDKLNQSLKNVKKKAAGS